jgi:hypothetical protein
MTFTRGTDAKEALGIGVFTPLVKEFREFFGKYFLQFFWFPPSNEWSSIKSSYKNIIDAGGGNVNKFLILFQSIHPKPISDLKYIMTDSPANIKEQFRKNNCKVSAISYYGSSKFCRKYDMMPDENSKFILVEICYAKLK